MRVQWIRDHAIPFRSIDPEDTDFSDLQPLREIIGNARIVQLGEQSHGDAACFSTKIRLIKFLHQELGFDVLAFESGLYDCHRAWQAFEAGDDAFDATAQGVFGIWTASEQTGPLWDYLSRQAASERPLELAGFDCQFTAAASNRFLADDLRQLSDRLQLDFDENQWQQFETDLKSLIAGQSPAGVRDDFLDMLGRVRASVAAADESVLSADESRFWQQQLTSMADHCGRHWTGINTELNDVMARDRQMAQNLVWLASKRYPRRKVIVWAASFHIMRNAPGIEVPGGQVDYTGMNPMGHWVHEQLGNEVFTIGFTAADGEAGSAFGQPFEIPSAPSGTLESLLTAAELENGLLPLANLPADGAWLLEKHTARPLGYTWMRASWPNHFDAMIFNRTMTASRRR